MRLMLLLFLLICRPAWAESSHDRAQRAVAAGKILPLSQILDQAERDFSARLIEAELEDEGHSALVYELKLLDKDGRLIKAIYDASTGQLLKSKVKSP